MYKSSFADVCVSDIGVRRALREEGVVGFMAVFRKSGYDVGRGAIKVISSSELAAGANDGPSVGPSVTYFVIDGAHRVEALKRLTAESPTVFLPHDTIRVQVMRRQDGEPMTDADVRTLFTQSLS